MRVVRLAALLTGAALLLSSVPEASARRGAPDTTQGAQWVPVCRIQLDPTNKGTRVVPRRQRSLVDGGVNTATITVQYIGFSPQAQAAFQAAVEIWQQQITSPVPISVTAEFKNLGGGSLLGQAGPTTSNANFSTNARANTWFPIALGNKLRGTDGNGATAEIHAEFNSARPDWYFGTDGLTPLNQIDFESVVLHEIGHGLGFLGSGNVSGTLGSVRAPDQSGALHYPFIYDDFTVDGSLQPLMDTAVFPDNSVALANALLGKIGGVFWNGPAGNAAASQRPRLYAPSVWQSGSSYSHLDEGTYPPGNLDSLMTPNIGYNEAIHVVGPITVGMFQDMGWTITSEPPAPPPVPCTYAISATALAAPASASSSSVSVSTGSGCGWTAVSSAAFAAITSGASGSGNGTVTFAIAANASTSSRAATLTIAGQTLTITQSGALPRRISTDVDGDNRTDLTVYRPATGEWFVRQSHSSYGFGDFLTFQWGLPGDQPLAADVDGDHIMDLVVFRASTGEWFVRFSSSGYSYAFASYQWGLSTDTPLVTDFDGDGRADLVVYRPSTGEWFIRTSSSGYSYAYQSYQWGVPGDRPMPADFDGDGKTDLAVYRPSTGEWFIRFSSSSYSYASSATYSWGVAGDVPVLADFDGDRKTDLVVYRPNTGTWYVRFSSSGYSLANWTSFQWGIGGDTPITADFDGDGKTDLTIFRPGTGEWFVRYSSTGYSYTGFATYQWGVNGDTPMVPK